MLKICPCPDAEFDCPYCKCGFCELEHPEDDCADYDFYKEEEE